jgi:ParB-like chromosome segregation protein Spo0J
MEHVQLVPIATIQVGERYRKHMGDLQALAASIDKEGLLHPLVINQDNRLIAGERRLRACRDILGWQEILCRVLDIDDVIEGQYAENEIRKDFTPSERVAIAKAIEEQIGNRRGKRTDLPPKAGGNSKSNGIKQVQLPTNWSEVKSGEESRQAAAKGAGFSSTTTYERTKQVVETAEPEVVEAMDEGDLSIAAAAEVAKLPAEEQKAEAKKRRGGGRKKKVQPIEEDEPEETLTPLTDGIGLTVPEELREVFAARELFKKARNLHKQLTQAINEIALIDAVASQRMRTQLSARAKAEEAYYRHVKLEDVLTFLKTWEPYVAMCPACYWDHDGQFDPECKGCFGAGWVPWRTWQQAGTEMKEAVKELIPQGATATAQEGEGE